MRPNGLAWALAALLSLPLQGQAQGPPTLSAPLQMGAQSFGDIWVHKNGHEIRLGTQELLNGLEQALSPEAYKILREALGGRPLVSLAELNRLGISLRFDEPTLSLQLAPTEQQRRRQNFPVRATVTGGRATLEPEAFSGYLNLNGTQAFSYPRPQPRQAAQGRAALVTNVHGYVLETGSVFTEKQNYQWRREDTRLVKDFESKLLRASMGDIPLLTTGFQSSRPMGGLSLTRQFSIQPYLNTRPLNRTEIWLKNPATIEVFVNDGFVSRMNAPAGPIQLSDFPLFSGLNKVDLRITDYSGVVEWVNLNLLYDTQLLGSGIQEFAYQIGAPSETFRGDRRYDDRNITVSAYHRLGLSDRFTLGGSFQSDRQLWLAGNDFAWLTGLGLISGEGALSRRAGGLAAGAGRLRFKSLDYKLGADKPLRGAFEVEYRSAPFTAIGGSFGRNQFSWRYDASVSRPLTSVTSLGLGLQYQVNRLGGDDRRSARLDFSSELHRQWRVGMNYALEKENKLAHRFQITLTWVDGKYFGNASYDYPNKMARMEVSRNPSSLVDDYRAVAGVQNSPSASRADALVEYTHEKAVLRMEHASTRNRLADGGRNFGHESTLGVSTALAWAGHHVGWTRPIADSFVMLKARPGYQRFDLPVNLVGDTAEATVNRYGPAVVPTLTSYNETPVTVDGSQLPMGYLLGREYFVARPTYRSGLLIRLGEDATVLASGRALKPGGDPLALATGSVTGGGKRLSFFTNREGVFLVEGLSPGTYQLELDEGDYRPHSFQIGAEETGLVRLPPIRLHRGNP